MSDQPTTKDMKHRLRVEAKGRSFVVAVTKHKDGKISGTFEELGGKATGETEHPPPLDVIADVLEEVVKKT